MYTVSSHVLPQGAHGACSASLSAHYMQTFFASDQFYLLALLICIIFISLIISMDEGPC